MIVQYILEGVFIEVLAFAIYIQMTIIPLSLINTTPLNYRGEVVFSLLGTTFFTLSCLIIKVASITVVFAIFNLRAHLLNPFDLTCWAKSKVCLRSWCLSHFLLVLSEVELSSSLLNPASKLWHGILVTNSEVTLLYFQAKSNPEHKDIQKLQAEKLRRHLVKIF